MATLVFSNPQNMFAPYIWEADVVSFDSNHITIAGGDLSATYYGTFVVHSDLDDDIVIEGGTLTGYEQFLRGGLDYMYYGASADALTVMGYLDANDAAGLQQYVFQYADTMQGSSSADGIRGCNGNDSLFGEGGDDTLAGDAGSDVIVGGAGIDTAAFSAALVGYIITPNSDGSYRVSSTFDGLDTVSGVEKLQFSDQLVDLATFTGLNEGDSVFRFYNLATGTHFYTADTVEAENVMATLPEYLFEGVAFDRNTSGSSDTINVYRFYNTATNAHFYTADANEVAQVRATLPEYMYEGVAYQAHSTESAGTTELYRFYNTATNTHFYTADAQEAQNVKIELSGQYIYEGVAYYVDLV